MKDLAIALSPLARPDIADSRQLLFKIILTENIIKNFQPLVIHCKTLDDIFLQALGRPDAEMGRLGGIDPVPDGNNRVKVIKFCLITFPVFGSMFQNGTN